VLGVVNNNVETPRFAAEVYETVNAVEVVELDENVMLSTSDVVEVDASLYVNVAVPVEPVTIVLNTSVELRPEIAGVNETFASPLPNESVALTVSVCVEPAADL
jgi:hypothetical protein